MVKNRKDVTVDPRFIAEHADRILAWEFVHGLHCAGKRLAPSRIADRIGMSTREVRAMIGSILHKSVQR